MKQWIYVTTKARLWILGRGYALICISYTNHAQYISVTLPFYRSGHRQAGISVPGSTKTFGFQIDIFMLMMLIDQIFGNFVNKYFVDFSILSPRWMWSMPQCHTFITVISLANSKRFNRYLYGRMKCNNCFHTYSSKFCVPMLLYFQTHYNGIWWYFY